MSGFRYTIVPGADNSSAISSKENQSPTYAAAIAIATTQEKTKVFIALTGALALTALTTKPFKGDELVVCFSADGTNRVVTPGAGFSGLTGATLTILANKTGSLTCYFDGTNWIEQSRAVSA